MTTSSSSNDKPNVTISSSSGEQVKPRKMKSKRYVKRSAKVDQPTVDSTDEQEAEQPIKQRRKRKFVKRSNPVPLTTRSSEDEVASDDGEIFISPECPTANNLFTEEQRIKSGAAPLLTERRTKMVFGRVNPAPPLSSSDEEDEVATSGDFYISSESSTTNISSRKKKSEEEATLSEEVNISSARETKIKLFTEEESKPAAAPHLTEDTEDKPILTSSSSEEEESGVQIMRGGAGETYAELLTEAIQRSGQHLVLDRPTRGDGNCCSYALVQQCQRPPVKLFLQSRGLTINNFMMLKENVAQFVQANSDSPKVRNLRVNFELSQLNIHHEGLRRRSWRQYWTDMQRDARQVQGRHWLYCWADDIWLQAAAWFLNSDVHIIWANDDTQGQIFTITDGNWLPVAEGEVRPRLYLGYIVRAHYQSLLPLEEDPLPRCVTQPAVDKTLQETLQNVLRAVEEEKSKQGTQVSISKARLAIIAHHLLTFCTLGRPFASGRVN